ncbi:MAG: beta-eliminating lyase-related protein [Planctomycetota bacterium]|nr:beta-eliminating lyase-related protein [Planctomycetota bacterium]
MDLERLQEQLAQGANQVKMVVLTVTDNARGGQPGGSSADSTGL